jgi:RecB family exonuclease
MKKVIVSVAIIGLFFKFCFAQQDPDDPGIQDSLIIQTVTVDEAMEGLNRLIATYEKPGQSYVSRAAPQFVQRAFSDYDHLARVREWSVADEAEGGE